MSAHVSRGIISSADASAMSVELPLLSYFGIGPWLKKKKPNKVKLNHAHLQELSNRFIDYEIEGPYVEALL